MINYTYLSYHTILFRQYLYEYTLQTLDVKDSHYILDPDARVRGV